MMFLGAPDRVLEALIRYVLSGDRQASILIGAYIEANSYRIRASRLVPGPLRTKGQAHDLLEILRDINERYFGSNVSDVLISWGRKTCARGKQRGTIKLGSYSATERLIRVHPALDHDWVPRYFLSYIVYHELLHHLIPAAMGGGRLVLHSPEFARQEREFRHYERALEWERKHLGRLLRAR
jgi:predicted metal-dependent hydrolase